jgi:rod shape-determining protein MreB
MLTAEKLKNQLASMFEGDTLSHVVNGRDLLTGRPRPVSVDAGSIYPTLETFFNIIVNVVVKLMAKLPPEVLAEINRTGIYISGGVAKIAGLSDYLTEKLQVRTVIDLNPEYANVLGAGQLLNNKDLLKKLRINKK